MPVQIQLNLCKQFILQKDDTNEPTIIVGNTIKKGRVTLCVHPLEHDSFVETNPCKVSNSSKLKPLNLTCNWENLSKCHFKTSVN